MVSIREQLEPLAVLFENSNIFLVAQVRRQFQDFVDGLFFELDLFVVTVFDPVGEPGHVKDVPRVRLILLVFVSGDAKQLLLEGLTLVLHF